MQIKKVVIVGGGTAGWMTAAALSNQLQVGCEIVLIESDAIGTVGVGEATIPPIRNFNQILGIDENEFLKETNGSFKLGIQFINWGKRGHRYFHPFGSFGKAFDTVSLHHYWWQAAQRGEAASLDEYCMAWAAAKNNRFNLPGNDPRNVLSTYDYAYHFDAGLYAKYLRKISEARGVIRFEGEIISVQKHSDSGFIKSVTLASGQEVEGELFIDCSGFKGLLIEGALKTGFEDWSHWLPCDRAWAVPSAKGEFTPYTKSTAHEAGWQWRIPLQHRTGNGHVFCSSYMSEDEARDVLLAHLDTEPLGEPRLLTFATGRRKQFWNKNVVAIGLSGGFLEPLESTSIHLIQAGIAKLLAFFPDRRFDEGTIAQYNHIASVEMENIRDFIILHYALNQRDDGELWTYCANMSLPDRLRERIDQFKRYGRLIPGEKDLFGEASWLAVHIGQLNFPENIDPLASYRTVQASDWLRKLTAAMNAAAENMPTHQQYVDRFCKS